MKTPNKKNKKNKNRIKFNDAVVIGGLEIREETHIKFRKVAYRALPIWQIGKFKLKEVRDLRLGFRKVCKYIHKYIYVFLQCLAMCFKAMCFQKYFKY